MDDPQILHLVMKPVLERLKEYLEGRKAHFTNERYADDGCPTCGYNASTTEEIDMEALNREIDAFGEELRKKL